MTKPICVVTVIDPDTNLPVEVEIRKCCESGLMVGLDGCWLEQEQNDPNNPYVGGFLEIPEDEVLEKNVLLVLSEQNGMIVSTASVPLSVVVKNMVEINDFAEHYSQTVLETSTEVVGNTLHDVKNWILSHNGVDNAESLSILNSYDGVCPDCGEEIPVTVQNDEACDNCGHVFCVERENDDN